VLIAPSIIPKHTTRGWKLCSCWKNDSTSGISLKDLKQSHPIQVAEYPDTNKLVSEPAFNWLVKTILRRRDCIIKAVKTRHQRCEQKFGLELPKTVKHAYCDDELANYYQQQIGMLRWAVELGRINICTEVSMMGIPFDNSTTTYCNNVAVVKNTTASESTLKKNNLLPLCREALAAEHIRDCKILGTDNPADLFTKPTPMVLCIAVICRNCFGLILVINGRYLKRIRNK
jgi:hypothetical protein